MKKILAIIGLLFLLGCSEPLLLGGEREKQYGGKVRFYDIPEGRIYCFYEYGYNDAVAISCVFIKGEKK